MNIVKEFIRKLFKIKLTYRIYEMLSFILYMGLIKKSIKKNELKLHLGSGNHIIDEWINIDIGLNPKALTMELPRGLRKFDNNSVHYIYASHLLEHFEYPKVAQDFVAECHRILTPEGVLRIVVPGIEKIIRAYVQDDQDFFEIQSTIHPVWCTTKLEHLMYAIQQDGEHKYGYDFDTIKKLLLECKFREIKKSDYNKSEINELRIDYRSITDNQGKYLSLYVDAFK